MANELCYIRKAFNKYKNNHNNKISDSQSIARKINKKS